MATVFLDCITQKNIQENFKKLGGVADGVAAMVPALEEPDASSTYVLTATVDSDSKVTFAWVKKTA